MKNIIFIVALAFTLIGCSNDKIVQPDSPVNTSQLMKLYSGFQSLLSEGKKEAISEDTFKKFREITTAGSNHRTYELLTFNNGEMLLIEFEPVIEEGRDYKIVNVKIVPQEMKELFELK
ncbi:MAG: hypothetical protein K0S34_1333 [Bacillales bacterium]|nr:hypothetical protein [Bacillales bacterium]